MSFTPTDKGPMQTPKRVSVSSWALHPLLGTVAPGRPGDPEARMMQPHAVTSPLDVREVPAALAARGITTMELCHFHIPARNEAYLTEFKTALSDAGVELWSLLIDDGDLNHPEHGDRDREWIHGWLETAAFLGARCARIIAGKQEPTPQNQLRSREQLLQLIIDAYLLGVHVLTENWFATLSRPEYVHEILESTQGTLGLCLDFGNWGGVTKYDDLAAIAGYAASCHAKCNFVNGMPDAEDFRRCLDVTREAGFSGPYTLVYGEPGDVWGSIEKQRELLAPYL